MKKNKYITFFWTRCTHAVSRKITEPPESVTVTSSNQRSRFSALFQRWEIYNNIFNNNI